MPEQGARATWYRWGVDLQRLERFVGVCEAGFRMGLNAVERADLLRRSAEFGLVEKADRYLDDESYAKMVEEARQTEAFAKSEQAKGLGSLYCLAAVWLWSILEVAVDRLVYEHLLDAQKCANMDAVRELKGSLVDFLAASNEERAETLLDALNDSVKASRKRGVGRFEAILGAIGLSGAVDEGVRRVLLELCEIRNVIMHRGGITDRRLLEACPWVKMSQGDNILVMRSDYVRYSLAVWWYCCQLSARYTTAKGEALHPEAGEFIQDLAARVKAVPYHCGLFGRDDEAPEADRP